MSGDFEPWDEDPDGVDAATSERREELMTPDDQPAVPAGLHPETAVICAGRPGHAAGGPLNVPVVLASNFNAGTMAAPGGEHSSRAYSRTDATPTWEALEAAVGQV